MLNGCVQDFGDLFLVLSVFNILAYCFVYHQVPSILHHLLFQLTFARCLCLVIIGVAALDDQDVMGLDFHSTLAQFLLTILVWFGLALLGASTNFVFALYVILLGIQPFIRGALWHTKRIIVQMSGWFSFDVPASTQTAVAVTVLVALCLLFAGLLWLVIRTTIIQRIIMNLFVTVLFILSVRVIWVAAIYYENPDTVCRVVGESGQEQPIGLCTRMCCNDFPSIWEMDSNDLCPVWGSVAVLAVAIVLFLCRFGIGTWLERKYEFVRKTNEANALKNKKRKTPLCMLLACLGCRYCIPKKAKEKAKESQHLLRTNVPS